MASVYDTTIYDKNLYGSPTFTGTNYATTSATGGGGTGTNPPPNVDYGDFVTKPPLGTGTGDPKPPSGPPLTPVTPPATTNKPPDTTQTPKFDYRNALDWVRAQYDKNKTTNPGLLTENPPEYWAARILEDAGQHDEAYWANRMAMTTAQYNTQNPGGGTSGTSGGGGIDFSNFNFNSLFDDPATVPLMQFLSSRIGQLTTPINDPNAAILTQSIQDAMKHLADIQGKPLDPLPPPMTIKDLPDMSGQFDALIKAIQANTQSTTGPTAQYRGILDNLVKELSQPAFSTDQLAQLKTAAVDTLNHEHQQALDNKARAMGMQGIPPSSGVAQEALKNVDQQYQTLKAQALQAQNTAEIAMVNERRQQLMQAASSSLTAAQQQAAQEQAALVAQMNLLMNQRTQDIDVRGQNITEQQTLDRRLLDERAQNINLRSQDIAGTQTGVSLAQALEQLSRGQRTEQNTNLNTALQLLGIPVQLSSDRLGQALQVLGLGSGGTSATNLLSALKSIADTTALGNATNSTTQFNYGTNIGKTIEQLIKDYNDRNK